MLAANTVYTEKEAMIAIIFERDELAEVHSA